MERVILKAGEESFDVAVLCTILPDLMVKADAAEPGFSLAAYEEVGEERLISMLAAVLAEQGLVLQAPVGEPSQVRVARADGEPLDREVGASLLARFMRDVEDCRHGMARGYAPSL